MLLNINLQFYIASYNVKILLLLQFNMYSYCFRPTIESRTRNKMFALHNIKLNDFMSQFLYEHCHNITFM